MKAPSGYIKTHVLLYGLVLMSPGVIFFTFQLLEEAAIEDYLLDNGLRNLPLSKDSAVKIGNKVRRDFNVDENTFENLVMSDRPFLRDSTHRLLKIREGKCGEGTRVIIGLLNAVGFDATRVDLYDGSLAPVHTVVSVKLDGEEFLVDSINSWSGLTELLASSSVSPQTISQDAADKLDWQSTLSPQSLRNWADVRNQFRFYSYMAIPYDKLLGAATNDNIVILNHSRPSRITSALAEKPYLLLSFFSFSVATFIAIASLLLILVKRRN